MQGLDAFRGKIRKLAEQSKHAQRLARTEEATKTSVTLPLFQVLGFDTSNLDEVIPEYVADVGTKKGEKVDFALKNDGRIAMLVEVKPIKSDLGDVQFNQLHRYFQNTREARVAILTNGREARFFSDTNTPNMMDSEPFFIFDLQKEDATQVEELYKFHREVFDADAIINTALTLKYQRDVVQFLKRQLENPEDEFTRFIIKQIHDGKATKNTVKRFKPAIESALDQIVRDRIKEKSGISFADKTRQPTESPLEESPGKDDGIVTTEEKPEAFRDEKIPTFEDAPGLSFTRVISASVDGCKLTKANWATLLKEVIQSVHEKKGLSGDHLVRELNIHAKVGFYEDEGFRHDPTINISVQNQSADVAWREIRRLAEKHNIPVEIEFQWKNNKKAKQPGQIGRLQAGRRTGQVYPTTKIR